MPLPGPLWECVEHPHAVGVGQLSPRAHHVRGVEFTRQHPVEQSGGVPAYVVRHDLAEGGLAVGAVLRGLDDRRRVIAQGLELRQVGADAVHTAEPAAEQVLPYGSMLAGIPVSVVTAASSSYGAVRRRTGNAAKPDSSSIPRFLCRLLESSRCKSG